MKAAIIIHLDSLNMNFLFRVVDPNLQFSSKLFFPNGLKYGGPQVQEEMFLYLIHK